MRLNDMTLSNNSNTTRTPLDIFKTPIEGCNLIEASAGTGKTWSITGLYLRMIVENELLPENILVVTFTIAATAELNSRIRTRLYMAQLWLDGDHEQSDKAFFEELFLNWKQLEISDDQIQQQLTLALSGFDKAAIYTIHSFCQRLLNDYVFEAGTRFNLNPVTDTSEELETVANDFWRIEMNKLSVDEDWVKWLIKKKQSPQVWLNKVANYKSKPYQNLLEPIQAEVELDIAEQNQAIEKIQIELSKVKETLLKLQKQCHALWESKSQEILSTIKAEEMLASSYRESDVHIYIATLNNLLEKNLKNELKKLTKKDKTFSRQQLKSKQKFEDPEHKFFLLMDKFIKQYDDCLSIQSQLTALETKLNDANDAIYNVKLQEIFFKFLPYIDKNFPRLKTDQGILDFDDMILNVYDALIGCNGEAFASAVASQFKAVLIDEFQDTDPLQLKIFSQLFVDTPSLKKTPLFYVGDPKQAIYSFRGADIYAYYQAAQEADTQLTLMTNYRSSPAMVDSVNALFSTQNPFISENIVFDWVKSVPKEKFVLINDDPQDESRNDFQDTDFQDNAAIQFYIAEHQDKPFTRSLANPMAVEHTAMKIAQLLDKSRQGKAYFELTSGERRPLGAGDIAVLVPRHIDATEVFNALAFRGISSVRQVQDKVLQSLAALTLLRLIQSVSEPANDSGILELLGDPLVGLTANDIVDLKENANSWEQLLEDFYGLRETWLEFGFSAMFRQWLSFKDKQGLCLSDRLMHLTEGERHLTDLMHLAEILQEQNRYSKGFKPLITWLQHAINGYSGDDEAQLRLESDNKRIKLVTLHACKGLEYNLVFCPFLWAGKAPREDSIIAAHTNGQAIVDFGSEEFSKHVEIANEEVLMEQLRLLYVAMTRGVHHCYIFWAKVGTNTFTANSALSWLLYSDSNMGENICAQLSEKVDSLSFEEITQGVEDLCQSANSRQPDGVSENQAAISYQIIQADVTGKYIESVISKPRELECVDMPTTHLQLSWWQSSFSGLVYDQHASFSEQIDDSEMNEDSVKQDQFLDDIEKENEYTIFKFPRGASPGLCIHSIFEQWNFQNTKTSELKTLVEKELKRFSIGKEETRLLWNEVITENVINTLNAPLNKRGFSLATVNPENRQAEMEFLILTQSNINCIKRILMDKKYNLADDFKEACSQIDWKEVKGFLIGFIDLIVKDDQGRYYVVDWKSNHLGMTSNDYSQKQMERAMASSHYYLQALIYMVALHRYLSHALPDYDIHQHLGGAWYIFIRGIEGHSNLPENTGKGIYHFQPQQELIEALDQELKPHETTTEGASK